MNAFPRTRQLLKQLPPPRRVLAKAHPFLKSQLKHIPFPLQQSVMEKVMAAGFREAIQSGEFNFLQRRWLCIEIDDLDIRWNITQGKHGPVMINRPVPADVTIRGKLRDFVALANQEEDPDTLFFQRRLLISGDTDLGLQIKNLMFATELQGPTRLLSQLLQKVLQFSPSQYTD